MKKYLRYLVPVCIFMPLAVFGDEVAEAAKVAVASVDPGTVELAGDKFLKFLVESLGGLKGAGTLGLVGVVSQGIMKAMQTSFLGGVAGKWRLLIIYLMNLIGGTVALMSTGGMGFLAAMLHSNTLANVSVFGHQVYKQFLVKKE